MLFCILRYQTNLTQGKWALSLVITNGAFNLPRGFVFSCHAQCITPTHTRTALIYQFNDLILMHFIRPGDSEVICYHKVPMVMQVYNNNITEQKVSLFCFLNLRSFIRFIFHISTLQFYYLITSYIKPVFGIKNDISYLMIHFKVNFHTTSYDFFCRSSNDIVNL